MEVYLNKLIITIDGPSGSGKERIAKYISKKYKLYHLDSGILYRRLAAIFSKRDVNLNDEQNIKKILNTLTILSHRRHSDLRSEEIGKKASIIATKQTVRNFINKQQRLVVNKILQKFKGCVIDGRDIGNKVFKNAQIKLFIDVNVEIRAKRRHKQLNRLGEKTIYSCVLKDLKLRDRKDINRTVSPLIRPHNAILIDNSNTFKSTCDQINTILNKK